MAAVHVLLNPQIGNLVMSLFCSVPNLGFRFSAMILNVILSAGQFSLALKICVFSQNVI